MKDFTIGLPQSKKNEILAIRAELAARGDGVAWDTVAYDKLRKLLMYAAEMRIDTMRFSADTLFARLELVPSSESMHIDLSVDPDAYDGSPVFTSDGQSIVFNSYRSSKWAAWLMDANGTNHREIVTDMSYVYTPSPSPSGDEIVFLGPIQASYTATTIGSDYNIYIMNADGTNIRNLAMVTGAPNLNGFGNNPVFSPDGEWIVFQSEREQYANDRADLFKIRPDGSEETRLTNFAANTNPQGVDKPSWSSEGDWIYFSGIFTSWDIWRIKPDGTARERISRATDAELYPVLSPYRDRIAYVSNLYGQYDLYNMNTDGTDVRRLTSNAQDDTRPVWSPDQTSLVFQSKRSGQFKIYSTPAFGVPTNAEFRHEYYMQESPAYHESWAYEHVPSYIERVNLDLLDRGNMEFPYREADPGIVDRSLFRHGYRALRDFEEPPEDVLKLTEPLPSTGALYPSEDLYPGETLYPSEQGV